MDSTGGRAPKTGVPYRVRAHRRRARLPEGVVSQFRFDLAGPWSAGGLYSPADRPSGHCPPVPAVSAADGPRASDAAGDAATHGSPQARQAGHATARHGGAPRRFAALRCAAVPCRAASALRRGAGVARARGWRVTGERGGRGPGEASGAACPPPRGPRRRIVEPACACIAGRCTRR
eukprot:scaffold910_cov396-Prasinococcus_capsulatus_cf.AAC.43